MKKLLFILSAVTLSTNVFAQNSEAWSAYFDSLTSSNRLRGASWSVMFYSLEDDSVIYEREADRLLIPASVAKMVVSAAAVDALGPNFKFVTRIFSNNSIGEDGRLAGDLVVAAGGDPGFEMKADERLHVPVLQSWADSLWERGLRTLDGDVILKTSPYRLECGPSVWEIGDVREGFAPAIDGFGYNNNVCQLAIFPRTFVDAPAVLQYIPSYSPVEVKTDVTTSSPDDDHWVDFTVAPCVEYVSMNGSVRFGDKGEYLWVPVQDPALYFGRAFKDALERRGISVGGEVFVDRIGSLPDKTPLFEYFSQPVTHTLTIMNKESDNYSAEYILRALGMSRSGSGTTAAGLKAIGHFLRNCGVDSDEIMLVDGCGLARRDLCSARGLVKLLTAMDHHEYSDVFRSTLSVAGVDGTLSGRMSKQTLNGRVHAKTGTMTNVSSLAGYLTLASGEDIAFAILCNNFRASRQVVRGVQDKMIERIFMDIPGTEEEDKLMSAIVECVPNISEGRDLDKVHRIANTVTAVCGVKLLDVDPNGDYNRAVITYAGEPQACVEATFRLTKAAAEEIDMRTHKGEHPRSGAVDVAPFVPVSGITMSECAKLSRQYGKRVGDELGIPVYLYEAAASKPERQNLATVRKGEYEALEEKLKSTEWIPDFGPTKFVPSFGCVITGARFFLIAYNVNIAGENVDAVHDVALHIRQMGWPMKDENGNEFLTAEGKKIFHPGPLQNTKAMGVFLPKEKFCQVSINLTNYWITAPHIAFEQARVEAEARGLKVTGSEVVGLIPLEALLIAADYYVWRDQLERPTSISDAVQLAHDKMELSDFNKFDPQRKIIEYAIHN